MGAEKKVKPNKKETGGGVAVSETGQGRHKLVHKRKSGAKTDHTIHGAIKTMPHKKKGQIGQDSRWGWDRTF